MRRETTTRRGSAGSFCAVALTTVLAVFAGWQLTASAQDGLTNIAPLGTATQSSLGWKGVPQRAIDENTDGKYSGESVTHTESQTHAWWQVELPRATAVQEVRIWNRTDGCCAARLSDFWVFASDTPFHSSDPEVLARDPNVVSEHVTQRPSPSLTVPIEGDVRYIRVQLDGTGILSLAEVEVMAGNPPRASQSSTYDLKSAGPGAAIDGNTDGNFWAYSVTHTARGDKNPWWNTTALEPAGQLREVTIWNRTDCCRSRLKDATLKVSLTSSNACVGDAEFEYPVSVPTKVDNVRIELDPLPDGTWPIPKSVCIQKDTPSLSLAEVQFGYNIEGTADDDVLTGGNGSDTIYGYEGSDELFARDGDDTVVAGPGDDDVHAGRGDDTMSGGDGADDFYVGHNLGNDTITDYSPGVDKLHFYIAHFEDISFTESPDGTLVWIPHNSVYLQGVTTFDQRDIIEHYIE